MRMSELMQEHTQEQIVSNNSEGNRPPKVESAHFLPLKLGFIALCFFLMMLALSSFYKPENIQLWSDFVKITLAYLFGYGVSKVSSK